jgi:eukaryotic-like serine/threonine-protein kinase
LSSGLLGGLKDITEYLKKIKPVEKLRWSWSTAQREWTQRLFEGLRGGEVLGLGYGLVGGLGFGLGFGLVGGQANRLGFGLVGGLANRLGSALFDGLGDRWGSALFVGVSFGLIGLVGGLLFGLVWMLLGVLCSGVVVGEVGVQSFPNDGIRRSLRNASIGGVLGGLLGGVVFGLSFGLGYGLRQGLLGGLFGGLLGGFGVGLGFGGFACLHHFALRLVLWHNNFAPLNYIRFLDYATARILLHKVGGGYVFVHRLLLEYFATLHQTSADE